MASIVNITSEKQLRVNNPAAAEPERQRFDPAGKSAAEYAYEAMRLHELQYQGQGTPPPALLKWMGDAGLAVAPKNRIDCAIGLTAGLTTAGTVAKVATGYGLDGKIVEKAKVPTFLHSIYKIVKNHDPKGLDSRNRYIKYAQWAVYSLGGLIGVKIGTETAYKDVAKNNRNPHYLEEYLSRVSMHQGETWSWLAAASSIFGSASGLFTLPIPGVNYGLSLAARSTSMQDRNFMLKGMNEWMSGASTTSYLRLKEGAHYLCHYAADNPAKTPTKLEFLAFTLLGPIFKDQLTAKHIQQFAEAVHAVRDPYWQPGGIPKEKRAEVVDTMKEVFTGAGLEVLLMDMGLNPGAIAFDKLNGITGKIGNMGVLEKVHAEQEAYHAALRERLPRYVADGQISQERADWVIAGMDALRQGKPASDAPSEEAPPVIAGEQDRPSKRFSENLSKRSANSIERLIEAAQKDSGDWRETTLRQKQSKKDFPLMAE